MNFDAIGKAMLILFDELKDDPKSKKLIQQIDEAESDSQIKSGFKKGIARLRELGKNTLADDLEQKIKGF